MKRTIFSTNMQRKRSFFLLLILAGILTSLCGPAQAALVERLEPVRLSTVEGAILLDARPLEAWQRGHIPGALSFSWQNYLPWDAETSTRKLNEQEVITQLGKLGISATDVLVIYGDADSSWGGEGWACWLFSLLGHKGRIYLLDGGIQAWQQLGKPLTSVRSTLRPPGIYQAQPRPHLSISTKQLAANLQHWQIVDTRSLVEKLRATIPGAVRIHWRDFYTGAERRPISGPELLTLLRQNGINPNQPVVYYCTAGVRSAYAWTVHELAGLPSAVNYAGGIEAWSAPSADGRRR